jgi:pyruvate dehydrogenase E1 component alpha subunit
LILPEAMTAEELIAFEKDIAEIFNRGEIRAPIHLSGNNEAQLISIFESIKPTDWVFSTWRSHYHALCHGVPPARVKAEIMAGRSIALCFPEHRFFSSAIVGGTLPIALGVALAIKRRSGTENVHVFVGDMTIRTGMFNECFQYAIGHLLPMHFVIEDNGRSVCTPTEEVWGRSNMPEWGDWRIQRYNYKLRYPHAGAGVRVQF